MTDPLECVDNEIGEVGVLLQPTRPAVQIPNQLIRWSPLRADLLDECIRDYPLMLASHRLQSVFGFLPLAELPSDKTIRVYKNGQPMDGQTFSCTVNPWVFAIQVTKNGDVYLAATRNDVWTDGGIFKNGTMITKAPDNCWFSTLQLDE